MALQARYALAGDLHLIAQFFHERQSEDDVVHDVGVGHLPERMNLQRHHTVRCVSYSTTLTTKAL